MCSGADRFLRRWIKKKKENKSNAGWQDRMSDTWSGAKR
jgi:hypothetical protein